MKDNIVKQFNLFLSDLDEFHLIDQNKIIKNAIKQLKERIKQNKEYIKQEGKNE
jgi:gas vesicle protein